MMTQFNGRTTVVSTMSERAILPLPSLALDWWDIFSMTMWAFLFVSSADLKT